VNNGLFINEFLKFLTKLFIGNFSVDSGTGFTDGFIVVFISQHGGMQRPLSTSPRPSFMHSASFFIKDTMPVNRFHLHNISGYPPVFFVEEFEDCCIAAI